MKKSWIAAGSLSVIAAVAIAVPAVRGLAIESAAEAKAAECATLAGDVTGKATDLQGGLSAAPPKLDRVGELVNGLLDPVLELIDAGCLPKPELPAAAPAGHEEQLPPLPTVVPSPSALPSGIPLPSASAVPTGLPLPSASALPVRDALPAVPVCTDLTADLLDAVTGVLAALLSTSAPDITAALSEVADVLKTLTSLTDAANKCLPAASAAKR